jgi:hypothetical protein
MKPMWARGWEFASPKGICASRQAPGCFGYAIQARNRGLAALHDGSSTEPARVLFLLAGALLISGLFSASLWAASTVTGPQFAVAESGAMTLSVPIQVPRGIGGMEPQLSLSYSSGSGNGLLGSGWTLTGPSTISRCAKSRALDGGVRGSVNFTVGDRNCLDGQRLLIYGQADSDAPYGTAGTTYRTERDMFSPITEVAAQFVTAR